jgi:CheY-like chemotaxis protein
MKRKFRCIFIIDNDEDSKYLLKCFNERLKLTSNFLTFSNGLEALTYLKKNDNVWPEIIILDLKMPIMDGYGFLDEFMKNIPEGKLQPKIYILTGSTDPADMKKSGKHDIDGYIVKPLTEKKLKYIIK